MHGVCSACAALFLLLGANAAARPDLVESTVEVSQQGRVITVTDTVRNRGSAAAAASTTAYFVAHVQVGTRAVGSLTPGASSRRSVKFAIPSTLRSGSWRLSACADARFRIRESSERNNCRLARQTVEVGDVTPPGFGGLIRATTCIPGPAGGPVRNRPYALSWDAASDNMTPQSKIVYEIYESHVSGGEDFTHATYISDPGATLFMTPPLPDDVAHYFVVRARDEGGNLDRNTVERPGRNLCL